MKHKILLATTLNWPSTARLAGAFALLGAAVEAVAPRRHVLNTSRYPKHVHRYAPFDPLGSFARAIETAEPTRVIACDDRALMLLLALSRFAPLLRQSLGPLESYCVLTARSPSIAAAREEAVIAPLTLAVGDCAQLPEAIARVGLPCMMKSDSSWGGDGVKLVHTAQEAERAFVRLKGPPARLRSLARAILRNDLHFVGEALTPRACLVNVQTFVPGTPATSVFAARDGLVLASLHMDVLASDGSTGPASRMRHVEDVVMEDAARRIAVRFRLSGLIGLDFVRDPAGLPHLVEINPRAAQICHLALGPDLPAALLDAAPRPAVTRLKDIALFPQLVTGGRPGPAVYEDVPWDDPGLLRALARRLLPKAEPVDSVIQFSRPTGAGPRLWRAVSGR